MIDLEDIQLEERHGSHLPLIQRVLNELDYGRMLKSVFLAYGSVPPVHGATVSRSPRLVIGLAGQNVMLIPAGNRMIEITLCPCDAVFISGEAWNYTLQKRRNSFMTLDFSASNIRYFCKVKYPGEGRGEPWFMFRRLGPPERHILQSISALEIVCQNYGCDGVPAAWGLVASLIQQAYDVLKSESETGYTTPSGRWEVVRQFIEDHLHEPINREDVAAEVDVHPNHLSRLVKTFAGMSYIKYLNERRLMRASDLLRSYRLSIKEVGERCGYTTPAHFSIAFKSRYGVSPGRYRKNTS